MNEKELNTTEEITPEPAAAESVPVENTAPVQPAETAETAERVENAEAPAETPETAAAAAAEMPALRKRRNVRRAVKSPDGAAHANADAPAEAAPAAEETPADIPAKKKKSKKKKSGFKRGLLIYTIVLSVIFIAALFIGWEFLSQYEDSQPKYVMQDVCDSFDTYLEQGLSAKYAGTVTEYENWESVYKDIMAPAFEGEYDYKKAYAEYTEANPVFTVYFELEGKKLNIANIKLGKTGETTFFGFDSWKVEGVEIVADMSRITMVSSVIEVPTGAQVTVNGKPINVTVEEDKITYPLALKYETDKSALPEYEVYILEGLYAEPEISVTYDGKSMVEHRDGVRHMFGYPESDLHTLTVTAPADSTVKVGGVALGESEIKDNNITVDNAHKYDNARYVRYEIAGFLTSPAVEITDRSGVRRTDVVKAEDKEEYTLSYAESDAYTLTVICPMDGTKLEINGIDATADLITEGDGMPEHPLLKGMTKYITSPVKLGYIKLDATLGAPEVKLTGADGVEYAATVTTKGAQTDYVYSPLVDESLKETYEQYVLKYAEAHINYLKGGYLIVEQTFAAAIKLMQTGSPGYQVFESTKFSFGQNKPYTVNKKEITTYDYTMWGNNTFSCTLHISMDITTSYDVEQKEQHDEVTMRLTYSKIGGVWKIVGLSLQ